MHSTAVIKRNIAAQHREHLFILVEFAAMNRLRLHRMEEGLHERIVGYLARTVHALGNIQLRQSRPESIRVILDTPIRMEDQPKGRFSFVHCVVGRTQGQ